MKEMMKYDNEIYMNVNVKNKITKLDKRQSKYEQVNKNAVLFNFLYHYY